ncbi:tyrosine-type recombinase/integrase [Nonomuraea sp. SYSU D8015]|uniref:tyrosine-type recombinase/integrase n=1 Tax=Nonomuraea sp. SYSU D8015 TaxID=2593644 RepID=UPI00300C12AC
MDRGSSPHVAGRLPRVSAHRETAPERASGRPNRRLHQRAAPLPGDALDARPDPPVPRRSPTPPAVRPVSAHRPARAPPRRSLRAALEGGRLDGQALTVNWQLVQLAWQVHEGTPKTEASVRTIALDAETVQVLRAHRQRQRQERLAAGSAWKDSGFVFTQPDGDRLHPQHVSDQFLWLAYRAGLPPIRLHDLRHGAASLAAGVEMKVVQETLGHTSSIHHRHLHLGLRASGHRGGREDRRPAPRRRRPDTARKTPLPESLTVGLSIRPRDRRLLRRLRGRCSFRRVHGR